MGRLSIDVACVFQKGVPFVKITDFLHHRDQMILEVLPRSGVGKLVVTKYNEPYFEVHQPPIPSMERVEYDKALNEKRPGVQTRGDHLFARITDFMRHRDKYVSQGDRVIITWRGWPDFMVKPTRFTKSVSYPSIRRELREKEE